MKKLLSWLLLPSVCAAEPVRLESVVVTGTRQSLESAQQIKRDSADIVDSVIAAEIAKLPDLNVSDAVQRVTGVQIVRDRGEGSVVSVRGLVQVETTLNGREVFTGGNGRTLDFADFAAETLAGIDVYKTSSADRIEGGIGGTIDLRTRRPFDFAGDANVYALRVIRGDLVDKSTGQASALLSRRIRLGGGGEFGVLVNVALQDRAWREDQKSVGNPIVRTDLVPGQSLTVPNGTSETVSLGKRKRATASLLLQWRPNDALELNAEAHFARLKTKQDSQQINVSVDSSTSFVPGSATFFPGTSDLRSITWTNAPFSILSFARDTVDRTHQFALGGRWNLERTTLTGDISYTKSFNDLFFSGPVFGGRVAQFSQDLEPGVPSTSVAGTDLMNPANMAYRSLAYRTRPFNGDLFATRLDAQWQLDRGALERVSMGWRYARRRADNEPGLIIADAALSGPTAAATPDRIEPMPYGNFLDGRASSVSGFLVGNLADARDAIGLRNAFGITQAIPTANPLSLWRIREQTHALYGMAHFKVPNWPLDGNVGLRVVHTREQVDGSQSVPDTGAVEPVTTDSGHTDWLPSANLRYALGDGVQLRAAASRTVTRANFDQLSPSLTLVRNSVNPALNTGGAGNPALRSIRSNNVDLALEAFGKAGHAASLTAFWKKVDGFIRNDTQPELHDGEIYQVSRPYNLDTADVDGVELAYQRFLDFLPGAWRGLGFQANYTYVHSRTYDLRLAKDVPLPNLSRHSGNLIALYEYANVSARLAYNWRSRFLSSVTTFVGVGAWEAYTRGYGWVDASVSWRIDPRVTLTLEGSNLTGTLRRSYYRDTYPQNALVNDRQIAARVSVTF
ncbi:MAG TPA: TonB-dependent receptor [Burkholderiaceae bacterium]